MLSGSAILRISLLLVVAGCLAALVQYLLPHGVSAPDVPVPAPATSAPPSPAPRKIETLPAPQAPAYAPSAPAPPPQPKAEGSAPPAVPPSPPQPATAEPAPPQPTGQAAIDEAGDTAGPPALALVDINTASLAELNRMRGGGSIGRAIIQRRPYATIDQLLSKRVLSRATYDKIKDQVTVR